MDMQLIRYFSLLMSSKEFSYRVVIIGKQALIRECLK